MLRYNEGKLLLNCYICKITKENTKSNRAMKKRECLPYESPQSTSVELRMDRALLQASKPDYIDGGDDTWVTSSMDEEILF